MLEVLRLQEDLRLVEEELEVTKNELRNARRNAAQLAITDQHTITRLEKRIVELEEQRRTRVTRWRTAFQFLAGTSGATSVAALVCVLVPTGPVGWLFGAVGGAVYTFGALSIVSSGAARVLSKKLEAEAGTGTGILASGGENEPRWAGEDGGSGAAGGTGPAFSMA